MTNNFDNSVSAYKMATTDLFRNMDRPFETILIIKCKLWIC